MHSDDVALFQPRMEVFGVEGGLNGVDVAAQFAAGKSQGEKQLAATGRINGIVDAVVGVRRRDRAGTNAAQLIGPAHAFEIDIGEIIRGCGGERLDVRNVVTVSQADTGEAALERIRQEDRAAITVLDVVQQVLCAERIVIGNQVRARENGRFLRLVVVIALHIQGEPGLDGVVEQVGFGEAELHRIHARSKLRAKTQSFAQSEEIVSGIGCPDETAGDSGNATVQLDRILAALFYLERDIDGVGLGIPLDIGRFFGLQRFKIAELIQAQNAEFPQAIVEDLAFVDQQLTPDHFVARGGVAGEIDATDEELMPLIHRK